VVSTSYPPPLRWLIGIELARFRNEARLSMSKASTLSGMTKGKLANLETGRQLQSASDIAQLLEVYGAEQRSIIRLTALAARTDEANWWTPWSGAIPPWFTVFAGLERLADRAFVYEPTLIPGLLQTPEYAAAVTGQSLLVRANRAQQVVEFRTARASRLTDPTRPLWLHTVITSWALEMSVGTPEVHAGQLEHLAKLADFPTVTIQVLRPEEGVHAVHATGGFVLLNLDAVSQVGYIELLDDAVYLYDRDRIRTYEVGAQDLQRVALDPEESLALIRSMIT
jgi:transcriptional regulator with XRE-family HTH domain